MSKRSRRRNRRRNREDRILHTDNEIHVVDDETMSMGDDNEVDMADESMETEENDSGRFVPTETGVVYPQYLDYTECGVRCTKFAPMSMGSDLCHMIATKLHERLMTAGYTFAEVGYLNRCSVLADSGRISVRIYFDLDLATTKELAGNGQVMRKLHPALRALNGYFFYAEDENNLSSVTKVIREVVPKYEYHTDPNHLTAIDYETMDPSKGNLCPILVIECNFPMTVAFCMDIDLADPNFAVTAIPVGGLESNKKKKKRKKLSQYTETISIETLPVTEHPVWVHVRHTIPSADAEYMGYKVESVKPYLLSLVDASGPNHMDNRKKLEKSANAADDQVGTTKTATGKIINPKHRASALKFC